MAAVNVAMRAAFERCGLNADTATHLTDEEGIETTASLRKLTEDNIKSLCTSIRRRPAPAVGAPNVKVSTLSEANLKAFLYWACQSQRTGEDDAPGSFTAAVLEKTLERLQELREIKKSTEDATPQKPEKLKALS